MGNVKTNYRIRTDEIIDLPSFFVLDSYYDSFSDFVTVSMGGYGYPALLFIAGYSGMSGAVDASVQHAVMPTQSFSGSIGWIYIYESNQEMTGTARIMFGALIASR